ncbi:MAG TPA: dihydroneopterin aldolase [Ignavibacteriales bacterium]|nr:dihydroneopterin aldolase [Ignavibacteriales bacterium]HOL82133.1 dihydroneopterin aldolase [Ignavibacteriales bacterium]HOM65778.1 dihydroneopterin aldolase [Ignavibacteriales bacterium]HPD66940.1 dihydroneopterin aldolase [Ignavibacteriales bacterium]HPP34261.1 dihydroneopterin aldolase [Ignavibacteriales bacterium]
MKNIIRIKNAVFYAYHGAFSEEQNIGGKFDVDVEIHTDFSEAAKTDSLQKTIDYEKVYQIIRSLVVKRKYYLIESLANDICDTLLENFSSINLINIKVRKNSVPLGGIIDFTEVEVEKSRDEFNAR